VTCCSPRTLLRCSHPWLFTLTTHVQTRGAHSDGARSPRRFIPTTPLTPNIHRTTALPRYSEIRCSLGFVCQKSLHRTTRPTFRLPSRRIGLGAATGVINQPTIIDPILRTVVAPSNHHQDIVITTNPTNFTVVEEEQLRQTCAFHTHLKCSKSCFIQHTRTSHTVHTPTNSHSSRHCFLGHRFTQRSNTSIDFFYVGHPTRHRTLSQHRTSNRPNTPLGRSVDLTFLQSGNTSALSSSCHLVQCAVAAAPQISTRILDSRRREHCRTSALSTSEIVTG